MSGWTITEILLYGAVAVAVFFLFVVFGDPYDHTPAPIRYGLYVLCSALWPLLFVYWIIVIAYYCLFEGD